MDELSYSRFAKRLSYKTSAGTNSMGGWFRRRFSTKVNTIASLFVSRYGDCRKNFRAFLRASFWRSDKRDCREDSFWRSDKKSGRRGKLCGFFWRSDKKSGRRGKQCGFLEERQEQRQERKTVRFLFEERQEERQERETVCFKHR